MQQGSLRRDDVRRREPYLPALLISSHHLARDGVWTAKAFSGQLHVTSCDKPAHYRRAYPKTVNIVRQAAAHVYSQFPAPLHVISEPSVTVMAKAVVVAKDKTADIQPSTQDVRHEGTGRHGRQLTSETQYHTMLNATLSNERQFIVERRQQRRTVIAVQHLARMPVEGNCHWLHPPPSSLFYHLSQQVAMAKVNAIEEPYRGNSRLQGYSLISKRRNPHIFLLLYLPLPAKVLKNRVSNN